MCTENNSIVCHSCQTKVNVLNTTLVKNHRLCFDCAAGYAEMIREMRLDTELELELD